MILDRFAGPVFALFLGVSGIVTVQAAGMQPGQHAGYSQERDAWDATPHEWKEIQRRGFQDGIACARKDFDNHRRPDVNNREEYRHLSLPFDLREPYREGFRLGYERATNHLVGDRDGHMRDRERDARAPERRGHDFADDTQRRGFEDGRDGARKDFGNHRRPDVNNRDEYRHPGVPYGLQRDYREGFRRGYEKEIAEMSGGHGRP